MEDKEKELELLREYFKVSFYLVDNIELKEKILEIQKQDKLKRKIEFFESLITEYQKGEFNEILKELGYGR